MQFLIHLAEHLIDFRLEPFITLEHMLYKIFLVILVGVLQEVF
jgi:hypothetical protein